jgi:hypothetical protein
VIHLSQAAPWSFSSLPEMVAHQSTEDCYLPILVDPKIFGPPMINVMHGIVPQPKQYPGVQSNNKGPIRSRTIVAAQTS